MIKKKYIILSLILILFLLNINLVINSVIDGSKLFFNKVFVSIFPFIILSDILIYYEYHIFLNKIFGKLISKIFKINRNNSIIIILSMLTSQPSNSIYIKSMLDNKLITYEESKRLIIFTYFPSISFVIGSIGLLIYNSYYIGIILLINNYLCNLCIGLYLRTDYDILISSYSDNKKCDLITTVKNSINKAINNCFIILGNIIIFSIIINILNNYINNPILESILTGILELTNGINNISKLNIPLSIKVSLSSFILNFSGISIILQSISILSPFKYNIKKIIIIKLLFSLIFSLLLLSIFLLNI